MGLDHYIWRSGILSAVYWSDANIRHLHLPCCPLRLMIGILEEKGYRKHMGGKAFGILYQHWNLQMTPSRQPP